MRSILVCPSFCVEECLGKRLGCDDLSVVSVDYNTDGESEFFFNRESLSRKPISALSVSSGFLSFVSERLRKDDLVLARWEQRSNNIVDFNDAVLADLIRLHEALFSNKYNRAVFFTPIYHHRHTFLIDVVCDFLSIKRVFLYPNQVNGDLLPLIIEKAGVENRRLLKVKRAVKKVDISDFVERCKLSKKPVTFERDNLESGIYQSVFLAVLFCIYRFLKAKFSGNKALRYYAKLGLVNEISLLFRQRRFVTEYKKIRKWSLDTIKFDRSILIAAHTQPEASSVPEGGLVRTHAELAIRLKEQGFFGDIYYKEHPASLRYFDKYVGPTKSGQYRYANYVSSLQDYGIRFLRGDSNMLSLRSGESPLVITMTGTVALERALLGLRTIVTGYPWFIACPGVVHIKDADFGDDGLVRESWLKPDLELASEARLFIQQCLSESGIPNPEGIGNLHSYEDELMRLEYHEALIQICKGELV
jgi:hypothetical protein